MAHWESKEATQGRAVGVEDEKRWCREEKDGHEGEVGGSHGGVSRLTRQVGDCKSDGVARLMQFTGIDLE